jgi:hypothetical protein
LEEGDLSWHTNKGKGHQNDPGTLGTVLFATSSTFKGSFGSRDGAITFGNEECARRARAGRIQGQFEVLLCTSSSDAAERLTGWITYPVVRSDGRILEETDLWDGSGLDGEILDEDGVPRASSWTGCTNVGAMGQKNCRDFTYPFSMDRGVAGWGSENYWLGHDGLGSVCNGFHSLLCVQTSD